MLGSDIFTEMLHSSAQGTTAFGICSKSSYVNPWDARNAPQHYFPEKATHMVKKTDYIQILEKVSHKNDYVNLEKLTVGF